MARSGPIPKPAALKLLEGNRSRRPVPSDLTVTFRPDVGLPTMPTGLSVEARKVWKRLAPELLRYNLMSAVYSETFEDLCETVADVRILRRALRASQDALRAEGKCESEAWIAMTPNQMPVQHPIFQVLRAARSDMQRLLDKFGLNPAEQARVSTALRAKLALADDAPERQGFAEFED